MNEKTFSKFLRRQIFLIGLLYMGDYLFFFLEQNFFNTYLYDVLFLPELYISLMVSLSATMGLIIMIVWGVISDNTRSRFGRRRPYLLFGGTIAGVAMIIFGLAHGMRAVTEWTLLGDSKSSEISSVTTAYLSTMLNIGGAFGAVAAGALSLFLPIPSIFKIASLIILPGTFIPHLMRPKRSREH